MNKRKLYTGVSVISIAAMILTLFLGMYVTKQNKEWMYHMTDSLLSNVVEKYPDVEEDVMKKIISTGINGKSGHVLENYGLYRENFVPKYRGRDIYFFFAAGMGGIIFFALAGYFLFLMIYERKQNKNMEELECYCEAVLQETATLALHDNEEGRFSMLKNKVYDITMLLREKNQFLENQKQETHRWIADISHQLKTPITSLHMINELLYMDLPKEKKIEFLDNMQKDLIKIEWFVKTVLNLAKLDSKTLVMKLEMVSAEELSKEIVENFHIYRELNMCHIFFKNADNIQIYCDKKWMKEAIGNIVKNAVEHGAGEIQMNWAENRLYTELEIKDNGEGIERTEIPHIFERFYKAKNSKEDSVGLGMAFTKSIIEYQNGEIKVKSKKGEGTSFHIKLYQNNF